MAICSVQGLFALILIGLMICLSHGNKVPSFKIKAVNLGGWLVTEGWIKPSLFDAIPNKDLLDGTSLQFKSVTAGKFISAELGGGGKIVAKTNASDWETFRLWRINATHFNLRVFKNQFVGLDRTNVNGKKIAAISNKPGRSETFEVVRKSDNSSRVRIRASNGFFLQVKMDKMVTADYAAEHSTWEDNDPSVFVMINIGSLQGEFQVTNGYGPKLAPKIMKEHWSTFIVEDDFEFISRNGLNAVRIPVGWWIASDPTPPKPYVGGSLHALDNAFSWAEKHGLKVVIDLHAAPGSQNGFEHSSSRDGSLEWGSTDANIEQTVNVIDFLTARYAKSRSLYAVALINEPLLPGVSVEIMKKYYRAGYEAVRKHTSKAYVVMANRLEKPTFETPEPRELFSLANGFNRTVIDVHCYNFFPNNMTVEQNIDFIYTTRSAQLNYLSTSNAPPIFIGEWVAEWRISNATKQDYQRFAEAQLKVYRHASFGWGYWTLKNVNKHWSLEWMIKNGYIKL